MFQGKKIDSTPLAMYNYFIDRVRMNLHVCLAMSPIGDAFRDRLRRFPALINCCTIDWFHVSHSHPILQFPEFLVVFCLILCGFLSLRCVGVA